MRSPGSGKAGPTRGQLIQEDALELPVKSGRFDHSRSGQLRCGSPDNSLISIKIFKMIGNADNKPVMRDIKGQHPVIAVFIG
jgi:hypothetical protein